MNVEQFSKSQLSTQACMFNSLENVTAICMICFNNFITCIYGCPYNTVADVLFLVYL